MNTLLTIIKGSLFSTSTISTMLSSSYGASLLCAPTKIYTICSFFWCFSIRIILLEKWKMNIRCAWKEHSPENYFLRHRAGSRLCNSPENKTSDNVGWVFMLLCWLAQRMGKVSCDRRDRKSDRSTGGKETTPVSLCCFFSPSFLSSIRSHEFNKKSVVCEISRGINVRAVAIGGLRKRLSRNI